MFHFSSAVAACEKGKAWHLAVDILEGMSEACRLMRRSSYLALFMHHTIAGWDLAERGDFQQSLGLPWIPPCCFVRLMSVL